jgi:hypothetical protein
MGKNGRILFDRPKPTVGCSASGRRRKRITGYGLKGPKVDSWREQRHFFQTHCLNYSGGHWISQPMKVCYVFIKIKKGRSLKLATGLASEWLSAFRVLRYVKGMFR